MDTNIKITLTPSDIELDNGQLSSSFGYVLKVYNKSNVTFIIKEVILKMFIKTSPDDAIIEYVAFSKDNSPISVEAGTTFTDYYVFPDEEGKTWYNKMEQVKTFIGLFINGDKIDLTF